MFNPFDQKPMLLGDTIMDWEKMYPKPYSKMNVDPYTKTRVILMNGIEVESILFLHQFHRNCTNNELRRDLAMLRRSDSSSRSASIGSLQLMKHRWKQLSVMNILLLT